MSDSKWTGGDFLYVEELNANDGESKRLNGISTGQTVEALKRKIAVELGNVNAWSDISVAFIGQELSPDSALLSSFNIQLGDTLYFARSNTQQIKKTAEAPPPYVGTKLLNNVMFKDVDGKTLILHGIPINWKFKQLREKLGSEKNLETEYFRFIWSGKQLQDDLTLESYNMFENCTIHMVMRLRGGHRPVQF